MLIIYEINIIKLISNQIHIINHEDEEIINNVLNKVIIKKKIFILFFIQDNYL